MTPRERFIAALERRPLDGPVPHFELVFFLTMEAFGRVHPLHRNYAQWDQMEERERQLHREDMADLFLRTAERYDHSAMFLHPNPDTVEETCWLIDIVRARSGDRYFLMIHGDPTFEIPDGSHLEQFSYRLADDPQGLHDEARRRVDRWVTKAEQIRAHGGLDGFALCSDYCFNEGPFLRPALFAEFITPYLTETIACYRAMGFYVIKHTDGDIRPIVDQLVQANPHALHSIDPQAGVDLADIKRRFGAKVCLIGNVNCGLLQSGTDEEVAANVRASLRDGTPGGGYIFSTSNCIYTGLPLKRYELMLDVWKTWGERPPSP